MAAIDRIPSHDWAALEAWARLQDEPIEVTAETFEREYLGEWPSLQRFAYDRAAWEHGLTDMLVPFFDAIRYIDWVFGVDGCFVSIGHPNGVWIFQVSEEPKMVGPVIVTRTEADPE
jgi:hypothetical protein